jgi:stage III sporulation protein AA
MDELYSILPQKIRIILKKMNINVNRLEEIRVRVGKPLIIKYKNKEYFVDSNGELEKNYNNSLICNEQDISDILQYASNYSMYAHEDDIKNGFITIRGGHRIGMTGRVVLENERIKTMKNISCINIRVSHQIKGCADAVFPYIVNSYQDSLYHTLIISPPGCGKTTLLRDVVRQVSDGNTFIAGTTVGVIDERSEIGACYLGKPQNDLGIRTDILDCCPKSQGMLMLVRTMAPKVIAVDEIGSVEDVNAVEYILKSGCSILATVHGSSVDDVLQKPVLGKMIRQRFFERYIILSNIGKIGRIEGIYDYRGTSLYKLCKGN